MYDRCARLVQILESCDFDRSRLSASDNETVWDLARRASVELPRPGVTWASSPGADLTGGEVTAVDWRGS